jgi:uncharacterized protein (TIGR02284 family)
MATMLASKTSRKTLRELVRGEISAVETYEQALSKVDGEAGHTELGHLHDDHRYAADQLSEHLRRHGGEAPDGSGAWGAWAKVVEGTAKIFGETAALKALKEGEEHGIKQYEDALDDGDLPPDCRELIESDLLPKLKAHVPVLDRLMGGD